MSDKITNELIEFWELVFKAGSYDTINNLKLEEYKEACLALRKLKKRDAKMYGGK